VLYCDAAAGVAAAAAMLPYQRKAFYQFQLAYTSHARQRLQQTSHDSFKSTRLSTTYITLYSPFIGPFPGSAGLGDGLRTGGLIEIKKVSQKTVGNWMPFVVPNQQLYIHTDRRK